MNTGCVYKRACSKGIESNTKYVQKIVDDLFSSFDEETAIPF